MTTSTPALRLSPDSLRRMTRAQRLETLALLEGLGYTPILRARAHLVKERRELTFAGEHVVKTERKSFFRRLAEKKGSPRIDWEEVLVVRAP